MGVVRLGRTLRAGGMGGGVQHAIAGGKDIATGGPALAGADQLRRRRLAVRSIYRNCIDLVTGNACALVLERQRLIISREVSFGILAAEGKLTDIAKMLLFLGQQQGVATGRSNRLLRRQQRQSSQSHENQQQASSKGLCFHRDELNRNRTIVLPKAAESFPNREINARASSVQFYAFQLAGRPEHRPMAFESILELPRAF